MASAKYEVLSVRSDYIEHPLADAVRDPTGRAYNSAAFLPESRKLMQNWAAYLGGLKTSAGIVTLPVP